ncbi:salicylate 1-monooxygenase sala [Talaromyces proteolyticus]|uniref:Salicylate 1-monooxygenase sala n=1 Tax=Talaromyces proteolyticus TaxID=1131652 RepID=A0AAD4KDW8_9EURO|nr:salicylate 1-monooxygenase sala [Talaromyces proteolyticus]KAH8689527.1 salicylate 1-monooxygenase sala [Talaromyces proteolyticus]
MSKKESHSTSHEEQFEIAIVGGGICGLILAIGLLKRNVKITIYEQSQSFREIGAGVAFTANAIQCMRLIHPGIVDALKTVATSNGNPDDPNDYLQFADGFNQKEDEESKIIFKLYAGYRGFEGCHRAHLLDELVKLVPDNVVRFCKRLDHYVDPGDEGKLKLYFEDGSTAEADAVIGCDGIKSKVRRILLGEENPASYPTYSHKSAFRALIPMDRAASALGDELARNQRMHLGPSAHLLHFPVAHQSLLNVVAFLDDSTERSYSSRLSEPGSKQEVVQAFASWGPTVRTITNLLDDEMDKWFIFDTNDHPAPKYASGRVCIAGDAAHAASPHHGAGAGIGVEDALALSRLLELVTESMEKGGRASKQEALTAAFAAFDAVRRERTQWFVGSSRMICNVYELNNAETGNDMDKIYEEIKWRSHKIWHFDIDGMLRQVEDQYKGKLDGDNIPKSML